MGDLSEPTDDGQTANGWTSSATGRLTLPGGHALVAATGRGDDWSGALGTLLALLRATWAGYVPWL